MRTRRQFRPVFDQLALRIAPSSGICVNPMDSSSSPGGAAPVSSPMDPTYAPSSGTNTGIPYAGPSGSSSLNSPMMSLC